MKIFMLFLIALPHLIHGLNHMEVVHQWRSIDFEFPSERARNESIRKREFIPGNAVPLDVDVWNNGRERKIFMTFPKFNGGIPVTLATVSQKKSGEGPLLVPYPDWKWQQSCDGLTSAFRTQIDKCGRLWVIDSGMIDLSFDGKRQCQPQLVVFNVNTDQLMYKYRFADDLLKDESILANVVVDVRNDDCRNTFAYVADVAGYALLVLDGKNDRAWKVQSNTMYPYPPYGVFKANNAEFDLMDGILGLALAPGSRTDPVLYYHSLASVRESWVPTSVLRNERNFQPGENGVARRFKTSPEARTSQSIAEAFDRNGVLYFGMMEDNSINCWNSDTIFKQGNIHQLEKDNKNLQFASGMKVITNPNGEEELWVMTDRFQLVMTGNMKSSDVNFRIVMGKVEDLMRNSPCRKYKPIVFPSKSDSEYYSKPYYYS